MLVFERESDKVGKVRWIRVDSINGLGFGLYFLGPEPHVDKIVTTLPFTKEKIR